MTYVRCVLILALLAPFAAGQETLSVTLTPNPAPSGTPITVVASAIQGGLFTPGGALLAGVSSGFPGGPTVAIFPSTFLPVAIPVCGSGTRSQSWNGLVIGGGAAAPGVYFIDIISSVGQFGAFTHHWYCVTIEGPTPGPTLTATTSPTPGTAFLMDIANGEPGAPYFTAISATTDLGLPLAGGLHVCLDLDFFFSLSFPSPDPSLFFNFQSALDGLGGATGIGILIPSLPAGLCIPLHAQTAILGAGGVALTNDLSFTIQ